MSSEGVAAALHDLCGDEAVLLIVDEALTELAPHLAREVVNRTLEQLGQGSSLLLVDHRFALDDTLDVEALLNAGGAS